MEKVTFIQACMKYFGRKENQSLKDFADEIRTLTAEDRVELSALFPSVGYEVTDSK